MKRIICLALASLIFFSLVSCSVLKGNEEDELQFVDDNGHGSRAILYKNKLYSYTDERFSIYNKNGNEVIEIGKSVNFPFFPTQYYYVFEEEDPKYIFVENGEQTWYYLGVYVRDELNYEKAVYTVENTDIEIPLDRAMTRYKQGADMHFDNDKSGCINMYLKEDPRIVLTVQGPYRSGDYWYVNESDNYWRLDDDFVQMLKDKNIISE